MSELEFRGGPLNGYRVQSDADRSGLEKNPDGRYELIDGAYHWHVGQPAQEPSVDDAEDISAEDELAEQDTKQDVETEHVRPKRRPRTTTRSKATPGGA